MDCNTLIISTSVCIKRCKECQKIHAAVRRREYYAEHESRIKNVRRLWDTANHERNAEKKAQWYLKNREHTLAVGTRWRVENPELSREKTRRRIHRKRANAVTGFYTTAYIFERDKGICQLCGRPVQWVSSIVGESKSIDHIIPISQGGVDGPENVQLAHRRCNSKKGSKILSTYNVNEGGGTHGNSGRKN